jgi:hypothetical protein
VTAPEWRRPPDGRTAFGPSNARADGSVEVLHTHAVTLTWIREALGS